MTALLHNLLMNAAERVPGNPALIHNEIQLSYSQLASLVTDLAHGFCGLGMKRQQRIATYLPKRPENVASMFATTLSGGVFVPVNPLLKSEQVVHILKDCNVRLLVTSKDRLEQITGGVEHCPDLQHVVVLDSSSDSMPNRKHITLSSWESVCTSPERKPLHSVIDNDMASIFYTSGSTGKPKGVVLSHRNMVDGAKNVSTYLNASPDDRVLAVLPFSFDYGFSQLSITFHSCSTVALMDYLFPKDVIKALSKHAITGMAGVPPLWVQLAKLDWPDSVRSQLRYITNSGGAMPGQTLKQLRRLIPDTKIFLMYGLTEAFRSTYLDPAQVDKRPNSIGKAIPNAEVMVVDPSGRRCAPGEPGELVHRGSLVSLGYWNDPVKTALRYRPVPGHEPGIVMPEYAVWSGDTVKMDEEGYLYFVGRQDDMIKTSSYRVSPTEVEEAVYDSGCVAEAIAFGVPHPELGQAIVVAAVAAQNNVADDKALLASVSKTLPNFMIPKKILWLDNLPRNPNGKIDRKSVRAAQLALFSGDDK